MTKTLWHLVSVGPSSTSLRICVRIRRSREIVPLDRRFGSRRRFHGVRVMRQLYWLVIIYLTGRWLRSGLTESIDQSTHSRSAAASAAASYRTWRWNKTISRVISNVYAYHPRFYSYRFTAPNEINSFLFHIVTLKREREREREWEREIEKKETVEYLQLGLWKCGLVGGLSYGCIGRLKYPWLGVSVKYE